MRITLELNQKFGHGYQIHMVNGPVDSVYNAEPLKMTEAGGHVAWMVERMNKVMGTNYEPHEVLRIAHNALVANKDEFMSRRFLKDIETGRYELTKPPEQADYMMVNSGEALLSERGILLYAYTSWPNEGKKDDKSKAFLHGYCRLLASKGYGGSAGAILQELHAMDVDGGIAWCKKTFAKYAGTGEVIRLMNNL